MGERDGRPAKFISFEGIDGCGKSTLMDQFSRWLDGAHIACIRTREPGGTPLGEEIRKCLLDPCFKDMDHRAEVLLYTASRAQLIQAVIRPALAGGMWVLADRYIDATLAYQGYGRGLDVQHLRSIQDWATGRLWPHHTVLLDCDVDTAFARMHARNDSRDRIELENRAFHQRVRDGYLELAAAEPERFTVLNTEKAIELVIADLHTRLWQSLVGS